MVDVNPDMKWYSAISDRKGLLPRCPFASVHRCPRFYQSLSLLGEAGSTKIDPDEDRELFDDWSRSDVWPTTREQETSILGPVGDPKIFSHFCPEVTFERFGLYASHLCGHADEIDLEGAHARLAREGTGSEDWRWNWAHVSPMHYSECPIYSLLQGGGVNPRPQRIMGFRPR